MNRVSFYSVVAAAISVATCACEHKKARPAHVENGSLLEIQVLGLYGDPVDFVIESLIHEDLGDFKQNCQQNKCVNIPYGNYRLTVLSGRYHKPTIASLLYAWDNMFYTVLSDRLGFADLENNLSGRLVARRGPHGWLRFQNLLTGIVKDVRPDTEGRFALRDLSHGHTTVSIFDFPKAVEVYYMLCCKAGTQRVGPLELVVTQRATFPAGKLDQSGKSPDASRAP